MVATATAKSASKPSAKKSAAALERDKRQGMRVPCKVKVDCRDVDVFASSKVMNISRGGLFVKTRKPPPRNTPLDIEFFMPVGQDPVHATGSVVWVAPSASRGNAMLPVGVGIRFDKISPKDLKKIEDYIMSAQKNDKF